MNDLEQALGFILELAVFAAGVILIIVAMSLVAVR